jgi:ubiquinone/menaquinone biosynthesis C-methylase UbiE
MNQGVSVPENRRVRSPARLVTDAAGAVSMAFGRGPAARAVADLAELTAGDHVVDLGCGPGAAVREAARRGARATGIDPASMMLALARRLTRSRHGDHVEYLLGSAERIPLPDHTATVVWAVSSVHHWDDVSLALRETRRVLRPGGTVLLAERPILPGARGHAAAHGFTEQDVETVTSQLVASGLNPLQRRDLRVDRRMMIVLSAGG